MTKSSLLLIDKPKGLSSNNALSRVKKKLKIKKAGIIGILDPLATGMLPIVIGEATKLSRFMENSKKHYRVKIKLGVKSNTGDNEGTLVFDKRKIPLLTLQDYKKKLRKFHGVYFQKPPMFSSVKIQGKKLYQYARQGVKIERPERETFIHSIKIIDLNSNILDVEVSCSKGTYIRTLVEDIGDILKIYTLTDDLRRIGVGHFKEENMVQLRDLALDTNPSKGFHDIAEMVNNIPAIEVSDSGEASLRQGSEISFESSLDGEEIIIKNSSQRIIGIGFIRDNIVSPKRLLKID
tara:strand:+ start:9719 stop:10597 length:879 start_codon:yes stop_codon:yes gene_type:complete